MLLLRRGDKAKSAWNGVDRFNGRLPYRIALRPDDPEADNSEPGVRMDDIVVTDVTMFRAEDLGDSWWFCCYLNDDGDRIAFGMPHGGTMRACTRLAA